VTSASRAPKLSVHSCGSLYQTPAYQSLMTFLAMGPSFSLLKTSR
jgi:hypothetical protein